MDNPSSTSNSGGFNNITNILSALQNGVTAANNLTKLITSVVSSNHLNLAISGVVSSSQITGFSTTRGTVTTVNTSIGLTGGPITSSGTIAVSLQTLTNTTSANITMNTNNFFDGPSVTQGTSGVWFAIGTMTLTDNSAASGGTVKLWDGTTTPMSLPWNSNAAGFTYSTTLFGVFTNPSSNIKMSAQDANGVPNGRIWAGSTIMVTRIG